MSRGRSQDIAYTRRVCCPVLIASIQNQFERVNVGHSGVKCATSVRVCVTQQIVSKKSNKEKEGSGGWWSSWGRLERIVRII